MKTEKLAFWIGLHFKKILFCFGIFILIGFGLIGWNEWNKREERKNQDFLYQKQKALYRLVDKTDSSQEQPFFKGLEKPQKQRILTPEMKEKATQYEQAIRQKPKRISSAASAIDLADFYYKYGEKTKAKDLLVLFAWP